MPQKAIRLKPNVLAAMALFRGESGCEVTSDSILSEREETLEVSIHVPLRPVFAACIKVMQK